MPNFLSNDRKVILASAITGMLLLALLTLVSNIESTVLWFFGCLGAVLVYWNVPTWFSRDRQAKFTKGKYFNADNEEIPLRSNRHAFICLFLMLGINAYLIFFGYDILWKYLDKTFPAHQVTLNNIFTFFMGAAPYIMRHTYCFVLNRPMDTSYQIHWVNRPNSYRYSDNRSTYSYNSSHSYQGTCSSPIYRTQSHNIYRPL